MALPFGGVSFSIWKKPIFLRLDAFIVYYSPLFFCTR